MPILDQPIELYQCCDYRKSNKHKIMLTGDKISSISNNKQPEICNMLDLVKLSKGKAFFFGQRGRDLELS